MKTSVVLSAYNGEKFIYDQIESIKSQTVCASEVLIIDDNSFDKTYHICKNFIAQNNLYSWRIVQNKRNHGFVHNFISGLYNTTGDIVFFADQDDIWCDNKIERTVALFGQNLDMLSLTSTFLRFDDIDNINDHVVHPNRKKNGLKKINLHEFCVFDSYLGMATAVHRSLINKYDFMKLSANLIDGHDRMLNFSAVVSDGLYHIDEVLVKRRSYEDSVSNKMAREGVQKLKNKNLWHTQYSLEILNRYILTRIASLQQQKVLERFCELHKTRTYYLSDHSFPKYLLYVYLLFTPIQRQYLKDGIFLCNHLLYKIKSLIAKK